MHVVHKTMTLEGDRSFLVIERVVILLNLKLSFRLVMSYAPFKSLIYCELIEFVSILTRLNYKFNT